MAQLFESGAIPPPPTKDPNPEPQYVYGYFPQGSRNESWDVDENGQWINVAVRNHGNPLIYENYVMLCYMLDKCGKYPLRYLSLPELKQRIDTNQQNYEKALRLERVNMRKELGEAIDTLKSALTAHLDVKFKDLKDRELASVRVDALACAQTATVEEQKARVKGDKSLQEKIDALSTRIDNVIQAMAVQPHPAMHVDQTVEIGRLRAILEDITGVPLKK